MKSQKVSKALRNTLFLLLHVSACFFLGLYGVMIITPDFLITEEDWVSELSSFLLRQVADEYLAICYCALLVLALLYLLALYLHLKNKDINKKVFVTAAIISYACLSVPWTVASYSRSMPSFLLLICITCATVLIAATGGRIFDTNAFYGVCGLGFFLDVVGEMFENIKENYFPIAVTALACIAFAFRFFISVKKAKPNTKHLFAHGFLRLVSVMLFSSFVFTYGEGFLAHSLPYCLMIITGFSVYPLARSVTSFFNKTLTKIILSSLLAVAGVALSCFISTLLPENSLPFYGNVIIITFTAALQLWQFISLRTYKENAFLM